MNWPLGMVIWREDPLQMIKTVARLKLQTCQLYAPAETQRTTHTATQLKEEARKMNIKITSLICAFPDEDYTSISTIARTVGLTPPQTRHERFQEILSIAEFAKELNVNVVQGHIGFLPQEPGQIREIIALVRDIADYLAQHGQLFALETGQEPAQSLQQFIEKVRRENVKVNFDPANFILYKTDDPLRALVVLGDLIVGFHCKDGLPPQKDGELGREVQLGEGFVDFPNLLTKLKEIGYSGALTIERELVDEAQQERDVAHARDYLLRLIAELQGKEKL